MHWLNVVAINIINFCSWSLPCPESSWWDFLWIVQSITSGRYLYTPHRPKPNQLPGRISKCHTITHDLVLRTTCACVQRARDWVPAVRSFIRNVCVCALAIWSIAAMPSEKHPGSYQRENLVWISVWVQRNLCWQSRFDFQQFGANSTKLGIVPRFCKLRVNEQPLRNQILNDTIYELPACPRGPFLAPYCF